MNETITGTCGIEAPYEDGNGISALAFIEEIRCQLPKGHSGSHECVNDLGDGMVDTWTWPQATA